MTPARDLSRHLIGAMLAAIAATLLMVFIGLSVAYAWLTRHAPEEIAPYDAWLPSGTEALIWLALALMGFLFATVIAIRLGRRIVVPLESVAASARRIAEGDLSARAVAGDRTLGETARLVDDFNAMAERLERISRGIIEWHAQIAHELRTPVTILQGRLQGLAEGVFPPDEALFRSLLKQIAGLARIVEDLRVVSLVDSGRLDLQCTTVDLSIEIEDLCRLVEPKLAMAGFTLALSLAPGPARVDAPRIRQALLALIENAERHASPCGLEIELRFTGDRAIVRVVDQGPGMAAEFIDQAFDPFRRGAATDSERVGGTGLGLSVVRAIAHAHGGEARYVRSEEQSAFVLDIPCGLSAL